MLRRSRAKWLFTPDRFRNVDYVRVVADCGPLSVLERHIVTGPAFDALEADGPIAEPAFRSAADPSLLVYTSGTTADPKGVMHSARGFLAEMETMRMLRSGSEDRKSTRLNSSH